MCIKGEREYTYVQKDIYGCIYLLVCVYLEEFARNCYTTLFFPGRRIVWLRYRAGERLTLGVLSTL